MDSSCTDPILKRDAAMKRDWGAPSSPRAGSSTQGIGMTQRLVDLLRSAEGGARKRSLSISLITISIVLSSVFLAGCGGGARGSGRFFLFGLVSSDSGMAGWVLVILMYLITGVVVGLDSAPLISGIVGGVVFLAALGGGAGGDAG